MTPEERKLLEKAVSLGEQNNDILRGMKRSARWSKIFRVIYWVLIIGISFGAYVVVQPYVKQLENVYSSFSSDVGKVKGAADGVSNLFKTFGR